MVPLGINRLPGQILSLRSTLFAMKPRRLVNVYAIVLLGFSVCALMLAQEKPSKQKSGVQQQSFGTQDGKAITLYTLTNAHGLQVKAMNYGAIITSIVVPDRKGQMADIVLGHEKFEGYTPNPPYFGALVGRYAN